MTEDEMVGWHHRLNEHSFDQALGVVDTHHELQSPVPRTVWEGPVQVCSLVRMSCLEGQVTSTALYMQLARPGVY